MHLQRLRENTAVAWSRRASAADFARRLAWLYADKIPATREPRQWSIRFRYSDPIGHVRLHLRANNGTDAFVHSEVFVPGEVWFLTRPKDSSAQKPVSC
jgi:hypothetical protein